VSDLRDANSPVSGKNRGPLCLHSRGCNIHQKLEKNRLGSKEVFSISKFCFLSDLLLTLSGNLWELQREFSKLSFAKLGFIERTIGRVIKNLCTTTPEQAFMNVVKVRQEECFTLLEERMMDCCEERSKISHELSRSELSAHRTRYDNRINELDLEIRILWRKYRLLAGATA
jgi:hypothetical protein